MCLPKTNISMDQCFFFIFQATVLKKKEVGRGKIQVEYVILEAWNGLT